VFAELALSMGLYDSGQYIEMGAKAVALAKPSIVLCSTDEEAEATRYSVVRIESVGGKRGSLLVVKDAKTAGAIASSVGYADATELDAMMGLSNALRENAPTLLVMPSDMPVTVDQLSWLNLYNRDEIGARHARVIMAPSCSGKSMWADKTPGVEDGDRIITDTVGWPGEKGWADGPDAAIHHARHADAIMKWLHENPDAVVVFGGVLPPHMVGAMVIPSDARLRKNVAARAADPTSPHNAMSLADCRADAVEKRRFASYHNIPVFSSSNNVRDFDDAKRLVTGETVTTFASVMGLAQMRARTWAIERPPDAGDVPDVSGLAAPPPLDPCVWGGEAAAVVAIANGVPGTEVRVGYGPGLRFAIQVAEMDTGLACVLEPSALWEASLKELNLPVTFRWRHFMTHATGTADLRMDFADMRRVCLSSTARNWAHGTQFYPRAVSRFVANTLLLTRANYLALRRGVVLLTVAALRGEVISNVPRTTYMSRLLRKAMSEPDAWFEPVPGDGRAAIHAVVYLKRRRGRRSRHEVSLSGHAAAFMAMADYESVRDFVARWRQHFAGERVPGWEDWPPDVHSKLDCLCGLVFGMVIRMRTGSITKSWAVACSTLAPFMRELFRELSSGA